MLNLVDYAIALHRKGAGQANPPYKLFNLLSLGTRKNALFNCTADQLTHVNRLAGDKV